MKDGRGVYAIAAAHHSRTAAMDILNQMISLRNIADQLFYEKQTLASQYAGITPIFKDEMTDDIEDLLDYLDKVYESILEQTEIVEKDMSKFSKQLAEDIGEITKWRAEEMGVV